MAQDLINLGAMPTDAILNGSSFITPEQLNQPLAPQTLQPNPQGKMLPEPNISQALLQAGMALLVADQEGTAAGVQYYAEQDKARRDEDRQARRDQLTEYELLGRIRERQLAEMQATKKIALSDRLKKQNPDLADLIDLDPSKAAEVLAKRQSGGGPFEGTGMEAQTANVLLTGDPSSDAYLAAYNIAAQPKVSQGPDGSMVTITPDMSAYRVPTRIAERLGANPPSVTSPEQTTNTQPPAASPQYAPTGGINKTEGTAFGVDKSNMAGYAQRMNNAEQLISQLPSGSDDAKLGKAGYAEAILSAIPSLGMTDKLGQGIVKMSASPEEQQYLNAANEWIRAKLRKESGAVIGAQEMIDEYATYFPTAGDSPEVIAQKADLRKNAAISMEASAGGAYQSYFGGDKAQPAPAPASGGMLDDVISDAPTEDDFSSLSDEDIKNLAEESGMTVKQVKAQLGIK